MKILDLIKNRNLYKNYTTGEYLGHEFDDCEQYLLIYSCAPSDTKYGFYDYIVVDHNFKIVGIGKEQGSKAELISYIDSDVPNDVLKGLQGDLRFLAAEI
jgi:hypothetical protein